MPPSAEQLQQSGSPGTRSPSKRSRDTNAVPDLVNLAMVAIETRDNDEDEEHQGSNKKARAGKASSA